MLEGRPEWRTAALKGASDAHGGRSPIHCAANARVVEILLRRGPPETFDEWELSGMLSVDHRDRQVRRAPCWPRTWANFSPL